MRAALPLLLCLAGTAAGTACGSARAEPAAAKKSPPVIGCASLANYRLLMRQAGDAAGAAALMADPKADHLGCGAINPEAVTGISDHVALDGQAYDCLGLRSTGVCQWVAAGALGPAAPRRAEPAKAPREKGRS